MERHRELIIDDDKAGALINFRPLAHPFDGDNDLERHIFEFRTNPGCRLGEATARLGLISNQIVGCHERTVPAPIGFGTGHVFAGVDNYLCEMSFFAL
jgi:hypothetical protein